jgi:hypothetical protein
LLALIIYPFAIWSAAAEEFIRLPIIRAKPCDPKKQSHSWFNMQMLALENGRLVGIADYDIKRVPALVLKGIVTSDQRFWPVVTGDVATSYNGEWKAIRTLPIFGTKANWAARRGSARPLLYLDLEGFRPFIGKAQCGRLVLANGEATIFQLQGLESLLEPGKSNARTTGWRLEMLAEDFPEPIANTSLFLTEFFGDEKEVDVSCIYLEKTGSASRKVTGAKTLEGKTWLGATAQVTNDYNGVWINIGECSTHGEKTDIVLEPLDEADVSSKDMHYLLNLTVFRSFVGKYRYGQIILSNGISAGFELHDILSPL